MSNHLIIGGLLTRAADISNCLLKNGFLMRTVAKPARPPRILMQRGLLSQDVINGGRGYIAGTGTGIVTVAGQPAMRRIIAIRRDTMHIVRDAWSKQNGTYRLPNLNPAHEYIVMALDHERQYEPAAWDFVRPVVDDLSADVNSP